MDWFDREGNPISDDDAIQLRFGDPNYFRVAYTRFNSGFTLSTVWLGLNHNHSNDGPPLIFETMIFPDNNWEEEACWRYATEDEALGHHVDLVNQVLELRKDLDLVIEESTVHKIR